MTQLVLSLFPGIGLLDMAFESEGFCVVRGPDLLWGGDIERFHPPAGKFDGVIGGPPCQTRSKLRHLAFKGNGVPAGKHGDQIPEFERCVTETGPRWFVMENVPGAGPVIPAYTIQDTLLNNRWLGEDQNRLRKFWFGIRGGHDVAVWRIQQAALESANWEGAVLAGHGPAMGQRVRGINGRDWRNMARLQGVPEDRIVALGEDAPFTVHGLKSAIGNGVPLSMGRAVAKAVKRALGIAP